MNFFDTQAGYRFTEHTVPSLVATINRLAEQLEKANILADTERAGEMQGMMEKLLFFVKTENFSAGAALTQLKALWTAYCIFKDYEPDTMAYDNDLKLIWRAATEKSTKGNDFPFKDYSSFEAYMCMDLV